MFCESLFHKKEEIANIFLPVPQFKRSKDNYTPLFCLSCFKKEGLVEESGQRAKPPSFQEIREVIKKDVLTYHGFIPDWFEKSDQTSLKPLRQSFVQLIELRIVNLM